MKQELELELFKVIYDPKEDMSFIMSKVARALKSFEELEKDFNAPEELEKDFNAPEEKVSPVEANQESSARVKNSRLSLREMEELAEECVNEKYAACQNMLFCRKEGGQIHWRFYPSPNSKPSQGEITEDEFDDLYVKKNPEHLVLNWDHKLSSFPLMEIRVSMVSDIDLARHRTRCQEYSILKEKYDLSDQRAFYLESLGIVSKPNNPSRYTAL